MFDLSQIREYFPKEVQQNNFDMLREYLQCRILEIIYKSSISSKLIFIGGTALRIVHQTQRFSEDLDFDNKDLTWQDWEILGQDLIKQLNYRGFDIEIDSRVNKTVFHHDIKFKNLLFDFGLSPHKTEKLLIKVDSENQQINYPAADFLLNKFDVFAQIKVAPVDILLSMKFRAFMDRQMGRDIYDITFIAPKTKPNYLFLQNAIGVSDPIELKKLILNRIDEFDLIKLESRTQKFLFNPDDVNRIKFFRNFVESYEF